MEKQWYFNTVTEQPELGMISPASPIVWGHTKPGKTRSMHGRLCKNATSNGKNRIANGNAGLHYKSS